MFIRFGVECKVNKGQLAFEIAIKRCHMSACLIKLVKPYIESINLIEVARHQKVSVGDILKGEFWEFTLWLNVSGRGGVIVSPRKMSFWLVAIKKVIAACIDIEDIERLKTALEVEFIRVSASKKQQQIYSDKNIGITVVDNLNCNNE